MDMHHKVNDHASAASMLALKGHNHDYVHEYAQHDQAEDNYVAERHPDMPWVEGHGMHGMEALPQEQHHHRHRHQSARDSPNNDSGPPLGVPPLHFRDPSFTSQQNQYPTKPSKPSGGSGRSTPGDVPRPGRTLRPRSSGFQGVEERVMTPRSTTSDQTGQTGQIGKIGTTGKPSNSGNRNNNNNIDASTHNPEYINMPGNQNKRRTSKRIKQDKLELYEDLHAEVKQRERDMFARQHLNQQRLRDNVANGDDHQHERPIAPFQELMHEYHIIKRAMEDGRIDAEEAAKINSLTGMSSLERGRLMKQLFSKYGDGFQYDEKTGRVKESLSDEEKQERGLRQQHVQQRMQELGLHLPQQPPQSQPPQSQPPQSQPPQPPHSRSSSRGSRREWPEARIKGDKPSMLRSRGDHRSNPSDASSRATTPDHYEDDGGRHDTLRKQIRGIGEKIKDEWDQHRALVQATEFDKESHVPPGATTKRNQYKLLITPRNRNFLSQLGLKPEIARHLPTSRTQIDKLYAKLDRVGIGFVPTARLYEHFRTTGMKISESDANRLVQLCDTNSDGYVQKMDLTNALQKLQPMIGTEMCKPSAVARAQSMVNDVMRDAEIDLERRNGISDQPEGPQEVLNKIFAPKYGNRNISRDIGKKHQHSTITEVEKNTSMYGGPMDRFMTASTEMAFQSNHGYLTPDQEARLRKSKKYFVKLDIMHNRIGALEYRARECDAKYDRTETARLNEKKRQLQRYTDANLIGSDLYDRMEAKHRNRLRVMSKSPHLLQTFDIFNRGDPSKLHARVFGNDAGRVVDATRYQAD